MYIGLGIVLIVLGAILSFVLQIDIPFMDDDLLGWILIGAGVVAILLSFAFRGRTRPRGYTTTRSAQVDPASGSRVEETRVDPDARR